MALDQQRLRSSASGFAIMGAALLAAAPARAQEQAAPVPVQGDPAATASGGGLDDIVVTAQRRAESLQRAATPVDVINAGDIIRSNLSSQSQLTNLVPALSVQGSGGANTTLFVRGIGNFTVNGYSDPAIAFNYDGVYVGRPTSTSGYYFDLERIEVLKGPQGTLYGRNATGGAINVLPARPKLNELGGLAVASAGNYDARSIQAALNLPIGNATAIRVAGNFVNHAGYLSDGSSNERSRAARIQLFHRFSPDLTVRIGADYSHQGGRGDGATQADTAFYNGTGYTSVPTGFSLSTGVLDPRTQALRATQYSALAGRFLAPIQSRPYQDNDYYGVNAEAVLSTGAGDFTLIPAYRHARVDNVHLIAGYPVWPKEVDDQVSVEGRFNSRRFSIFDLIAGLYYYHEKIEGNYTFDPVQIIYQDFRTKTDSYAAFARLTAHLTDTLRLSGGLRYTHDSKSLNGAQDTVILACQLPPFPAPACPAAPLLPLTDRPDQLPIAVPPANGPPAPVGTTGALAINLNHPVNDALKKRRVTYRAAIEYDLASRSLLYASYETGYRSGGFALAAGHETFQPEYIKAWTIGSKNRFFSNRLQLNLEAFLWKYTNQQVSHSGVDNNGSIALWTDNVGKSTNKGVEGELQFLATPTTLLSADAQYLHTRFKSYVYQVPNFGAPPYTGCGSSLAANGNYNVDCSGRPSYYSPRWTLNLGGQQTVPLGDYKLILALDTQYKGARWVGSGYWAFSHVGANWRTNASLALAGPSDRWSLTAFVDNLENNRVITTANINEAVNTGYVITTAPRTYGVRGAIKF